MIEISNYKSVVDSFHRRLLEIDIKISGIRLSEDKWSLKELIGHLIDSASNNHQRFVRLQFDDLLDFPAYEAEEWISKQNYNNLDWDVLASLWYHYNLLLINIIEAMDNKSLKNVWVKDEDTIMLEELVVDYYKHMGYHIEHFNCRAQELKNML